MDFEIITVNDYYGNNFSYKRQAILYEDGTLEYLPEPEPPEEQEENYDV